MAELTKEEAAWIKGAADALIAIRSATRSRPNDDQTRDIRFLADAFHNIGMVVGQNETFAHMHTTPAWLTPRKPSSGCATASTARRQQSRR